METLLIYKLVKHNKKISIYPRRSLLILTFLSLFPLRSSKKTDNSLENHISQNHTMIMYTHLACTLMSSTTHQKYPRLAQYRELTLIITKLKTETQSRKFNA